MAKESDREIGSRLREIRKERRVTEKELAKQLGVTQSTVSKVEHGHLTPDVGYVSRFAHLFRLEASKTSELFELMGVVPGGTTPSAFLRFVPFDLISSDWSQRRQDAVRLAEERTHRLWTFQPLVIPGLLQTAGYAGAMAKIAGVRGARAIARTVKARLNRQRTLEDPSKDCRFILSEVALRACVATRKVLSEQLRHLLRVSQSSRASGQKRLGILPMDDAVIVPPTSGYYLFDDRVYVELLHGDLWVLDAKHVQESYERHFTSLLKSAVHGARCEEILTGLLEELSGAS